MSRNLVTAGVAAALFAGCSFEPEQPVLEHEPNAKAIAENVDLANSPTAQDQLAGALEMLFGTPEHPGYMRLESWIEEEYDPNQGSWNLSDEEFDALKASNRAAFAKQIAAIEAGDLDAVARPRYAPDLWRRYEALVAEAPDDLNATYADTEGTWRDELVYLFEGYYPSLTATAEFYRQQCNHCHGPSGGGDGSTAPYLNPRPRDYRPGIFKFTALANKARPRHGDLMRILEEGIYMTAMPSFRRFSDAQLHGLADYVELLAKRGETEILLALDYAADEGFGGLEKVQETYEFVLDRWEKAADNVIVYDGEVPAATPERLAAGQRLFLGAEGEGANCVSCHGPTGIGDGPSAREVDPETGLERYVKDEWGNEIRPRNLARGIYRFGRRPIDLYRRIYAGINGTPMPEHFGMQIIEADGSKRALDEDDIWNLVHYVRSLGERPLEVARHDTSGNEEHAEGH